MSKEQIARRWGSILSSVALYQLQSGSLTNEQQETVVQAYSRLKKSGFYSYSIPNLTPQKLDVLARKHKLQQDIKLVILDYVGRMEKILPDMSEWQVLEQIIKSMKLLAQNLQVACLVLVQLNPDGTLQGAKRMENECDLMLKLIPVPEDGQKKIEERLKKLYEEFNYRILSKLGMPSRAGPYRWCLARAQQLRRPGIENRLGGIRKQWICEGGRSLRVLRKHRSSN